MAVNERVALGEPSSKERVIEDQQPRGRAPEGPGDHQAIARSRAASEHRAHAVAHASGHRHRQGQHRRVGDVAPGHGEPVLRGHLLHGPVHLVNIVGGDVGWYPESNQRRHRIRRHRRDVGQVHSQRLVPDVSGGVSGPAEVNTVNQHVKRHHHAIGEYRCVVTNAGHHLTAHSHAGCDSLNKFALVGHDPTVPPPPLPLGYSPPPMIDDTTVRHVARLARLRLDAAEEQVMREELSGILGHIDAIRAMDLDGVPPTTHVIELENVLRADEPRPGLSQEDALREARAVVDGSFEVPRMD